MTGHARSGIKTFAPASSHSGQGARRLCPSSAQPWNTACGQGGRTKSDQRALSCANSGLVSQPSRLCCECTRADLDLSVAGWLPNSNKWFENLQCLSVSSNPLLASTIPYEWANRRSISHDSRLAAFKLLVPHAQRAQADSGTYPIFQHTRTISWPLLTARVPHARQWWRLAEEVHGHCVVGGCGHELSPRRRQPRQLQRRSSP